MSLEASSIPLNTSAACPSFPSFPPPPPPEHDLSTYHFIFAHTSYPMSIEPRPTPPSTQLVQDKATDKLSVSPTSFKCAHTFARPATPSLTITPIFTTSSSSSAPKTITTDDLPSSSTITAAKALRAVSDSNRVRNIVPRSASLPAPVHSSPPRLSSSRILQFTSPSLGDHQPISSVRDADKLPDKPVINSPPDARQCDSVSKLSRASTRCLYAILELVESEVTFVMDLHLLMKYTASLVSDNTIPLTDSQRRAVESLNVNELLRVHEPLSRQFGLVKSDIHACVQGTTGDDITVINALSQVARAFQRFDEYQHIYESYCSGHADVLDIIRPVQATPSYFAFEQKLAVSASCLECPSDSSPPSEEPPSTYRPPASGPSPCSHWNPDAFPNEPGGISRVRPSASLLRQLSLKSLRPSIRWSPSSSRQQSRAPSPIPHSEPSSSSANPTTSQPSSKSEVTSKSNHHIPPVPPIPPSAIIPDRNNIFVPMKPPASKPLAFRDLLIKPIQRVCRYPLLLAQLQLPTSPLSSKASERLGHAIAATRSVAKSVDAAQERREVAIKSSLILDRLEPHPVITQSFVTSLGQLVLASSLEAVLLSEAVAPAKVKFVATFLYHGYLLLVKVRKNRIYSPWHWFPLQNSSIKACEDERAPPNSFVIYHSVHRLELAASCQEEQAVWIKALSKAAREEICDADAVKSSLQLLDELVAMNAVTSTPKKRQSFFYSPTNSSEAGVRKTGHSSNSSEAVGSTISRTPSTIKRLSTASIASLFGPEQNPSSSAPPPRRSTPASRHLVDRNIRDVVSNSCLAARAQAHMNGELFQATVRTRTRTLSSQNHNPPPDRKRRTVGSAESVVGLAKMSEESQLSRAGSGRGQLAQSLPLRRRTQSLPSADNLPQPSPGPEPPAVIHGDALELPSTRRRTVFDLMDDDLFFMGGDSDDELAESVWEGDDLTSAAHTDLSSVETHPRDTSSKPGTSTSAASDAAKPLASSSAPHVSEPGGRCDVIVYVGKGITNAPPPQRQRSLFRKSVLALTRRGSSISSSSPSVPGSVGRSIASLPSSLHTALSVGSDEPTPPVPSYRSLGAQLLPPNWITGSRNTRPTRANASSRMRGDEKCGSQGPSATPLEGKHGIGVTRD